jgi:hypothetical protein
MTGKRVSVLLVINLINPASQLALQGLRDLTTLKWYVIPLLAIVFYVAIIIVIGMKSDRSKVITIGGIYTVAVSMNVWGMGIMGWVY